ncbi:MAG: GGDEF domain-containing protein [Cupriavidus sp.]|nr:GGDEF domain-containing protein [Cupriavidus sp.]
MYVDLLTLYLLAIGTLLASAGMTFWEHRANPRHNKALRLLAAGFATLAAGCAAALFRRDLPGATGSALSNLVILSGYLLVLGGVASLGGRRYRAASAALLAGMALVWAVWGPGWREVVWNHVSSLPIAAVSAMTAWEALRSASLKALPSRYIVVAVTAIHALTYAARSSILPWLVAEYGHPVQALASKITIYEGVLYSVMLPMALLKLVREETHDQLLAEARTDYLTRLGNRRWFFEQGTHIMDDDKASGPAGASAAVAVAVLAFDLDQFKAINDLHGHQAGDEVLKSFAETARSVLGPDALLARIGGEDFAALLRGDAARRAKPLGEAVARRFAETITRRVDNTGISATVSIGLAQFDGEVPGLGEGLAAADRALYRAKALGGNRIEVAEAADDAR